jgi:hypothetical protein
MPMTIIPVKAAALIDFSFIIVLPWNSIQLPAATGNHGSKSLRAWAPSRSISD